MKDDEIVREQTLEAQIDEIAEQIIPGFKRSAKEPLPENKPVDHEVNEIIKFLL